MSQEHKKSFVLYFDAYPCIAALPVEQRGELLLQLFRYAMAEDKAPTDPETILEQYPVLNGEGRMAYSFLAETIRRDTGKNGRINSGATRPPRPGGGRSTPAHRPAVPGRAEECRSQTPTTWLG
mgnify:CR=1 FL=1